MLPGVSVRCCLTIMKLFGFPNWILFGKKCEQFQNVDFDEQNSPWGGCLGYI